MEEIVFSHKSVLLGECIDDLNIRKGYTYIDCTTGGGGHSLEIAKRLTADDRLICVDRDSDALTAAKIRLKDYLDKITFVHDNYDNIGKILDNLCVDNLGGVLADLGCSSYQFDTPNRGFSYMHDAPLDMRMDRDSTKDAKFIVNNYSEEELKKIIFDYGEERFAPKIAKAIVNERANGEINSTLKLSEIIKGAIPPAARDGGPHPAKRTFQAIRIEVNSELSSIPPFISSAISHLVPGGRIAIISFHSLEDRLVKDAYKEAATGCTCPKSFPVCVCGKKPKIDILTKKPILPKDEELNENPRSRSARLRVAEKL